LVRRRLVRESHRGGLVLHRVEDPRSEGHDVNSHRMSTASLFYRPSSL
jgi:hypothetical protein